jgi:ABC-type branched-subunit amino acid transport system ATPase component
VADRFYVIEEGRVGMQFARDAIATDRARIEAILGL